MSYINVQVRRMRLFISPPAPPKQLFIPFDAVAVLKVAKYNQRTLNCL